MIERDFGPQPTYFLCFAKESRQRKATRDARLSAAFGAGGPLCFSPARAVPETRVSCAAAQTTGPDFPRAGCDARRALRGGKAAKRGGQGTESIVFLNGRDASRMGHIVVCPIRALPLPRVVPAQAGTQARPHSVATAKTR